MPPARSRVVLDDARSDVSNTNQKDRVNSTAASKGKKASANASNGAVLSNKAAGVPNVSSGLAVGVGGIVDSDQDHPHIDWSTLPMHSLQGYRSTYRLQIPSAYTRPHAELLYNSCDLALRAPSMVLARRKAQDLKIYQKRQAQHSQDTRTHTNGISKPKTSRSKDKEKKSARSKEKVDTPKGNTSAQDLLGAPLSPNSHPSQQESNSISAENASRSSRMPSEDVSDEQMYTIPPTLNQSSPEATIVGSTSANSLFTSIRKHFNAQQLNEADTIARFSYVIRQQGSPMASRTQSLAQRSGPLPPTTAELIASTAAQAAQNASTARTGLQPTISISASGQAATIPTTAAAKSAAHAAHSLSAPRTLAGNHLEVEGSYGDGRGHIMGTTSCGRQVKTSDSVGGGGTFRLRFRPAPWGQEVVGNRAPT